MEAPQTIEPNPAEAHVKALSATIRDRTVRAQDRRAAREQLRAIWRDLRAKRIGQNALVSDHGGPEKGVIYLVEPTGQYRRVNGVRHVSKKLRKAARRSQRLAKAMAAGRS